MLLFVSGEIYYQFHNGQVVDKVLAAETQRTDDISHLIKLHVYWKKIATDSPGYRDAFVQLALIDGKLGDEVSTKKDLQQILILDPNYQLSPTLVSLRSQVSRH